MAYGLPARGQADWDDELNNSVEDLKAKAEAAERNAESAQSNANEARAIAQAARADLLNGTSDNSFADIITDPESVASGAIRARMAEEIDDPESPVAASLSASFGDFAPEVFVTRRRDLPGENWRTIDGALVVPPEWTQLALADGSPDDYVQRQVKSVINARRAQGLGSQLFFRNDVEWRVTRGDEPDIASGGFRPAFRFRPGVSFHGDHTTILSTGAGGVIFGTEHRVGQETVTNQDGTGLLLDPTLGPFSLSAVIIDESYAAGATTVHLSSGTRADGALVAVGDQVYWPQGEQPTDCREPLASDFATIVGLTPDGGSETTVPGFSYAGACTVRLDRGALVDVPLTHCWAYKQANPSKPNIFTQSPPPSSVGTLNGVSNDSGDNVDNLNAHCLYVIDEPIRDAIVEGFDVRLAAGASLPTGAVRVRYVDRAVVRDVSTLEAGSTAILGYLRGLGYVENLHMRGHSALGSSVGRVLSVAGNGSQVEGANLLWENGGSQAILAEAGARVYAHGVTVKDWLAGRDQTIPYLGAFTGASLHVTDYQQYGNGGIPTGRTPAENETQARITLDGHVLIHNKVVGAQVPNLRLTDIARTADLRIEDYNYALSSQRVKQYEPSAGPHILRFPIKPHPTATATDFPMPPGLIRSGRIRFEDLTGVTGVTLRSGKGATPSILPSLVAGKEVALPPDICVYGQTSGRLNKERVDSDAVNYLRINTDSTAQNQVVTLSLEMFDEVTPQGSPTVAPVVTGALRTTPALDEVRTVRRSSDAAPINASTTPVVDTSLAHHLSPGLYEIEGTLVYSASSAADMRVSWAIPSGASGWWAIAGPGDLAASTPTAAARHARNGLSGNASVAGVGVGIANAIVANISGEVNIPTTGTLSLRYTQNTADASDLVIHSGSRLRVRRIA